MKLRSSSESSWWQNVGLAAVVVVAAALCALALTSSTSDRVAADSGPQPSDDASQTASPSPTGSRSDQTSPSSSPSDSQPPTVKDVRRVDFATSDSLPVGYQQYDNDTAGSTLTVSDGALGHSAARGPGGTSSLETALTGDVQQVGAVIRLTGSNPGSAVLVVWQSSFVVARQAGNPPPPTGLRLTVTKDKWSLSASGNSILATGSYTHSGITASFEVTRQGDTAWVTQPSGKVTQVSDPRIEQKAGRYACWQLTETGPTQTPASFEQIWAG